MLCVKFLWINHFIAIQKQMCSFCTLSTDQFCIQHCAVVKDALYVSVTAKSKSQVLYWKLSSIFLLRGYWSSLQVWRECLPACERKRFHEATQQGRKLLLRRIFCFCKRASCVRCNISVSNLHFFPHINCLAFFCVMKLK